MLDEFTFPRPEYPRPERRRGSIEGIDWINLNGPWQFRFDGNKAGEKECWFLQDDLVWREQIIVPFCWESLSAWHEGDAAGNENYYATRVFLNPLEVTAMNHRSAPRYEVGWYRRKVIVPGHPAWHKKRIILTIGAADFFTDGWCNGRYLGHHEGGYTPFEFDLTDCLTTLADGRREGLIVLRVEDPMQNHEQPVGKQWRWYTPTSGIWQTVFVEPRSETFIDSFRIVPDIDKGAVHFDVNCLRTQDDDFVIATITAPDGTRLPESVLPISGGMAEGSIPIHPVLTWDPNTPRLYDTTLALKRGEEVVDRVHTYFGMRKIDFVPSTGPQEVTHLRLNGSPRYLRGALYQSYFPEGVYTAGCVERLKEDILSAKSLGFNFLRIHIKIDDPLFLYYADTLGMMLMADFPNFGESGDTPLGHRRFEQMMRETIKRDFNHPSIFAWCMFNETWGFGGQVDLVKLIHPTRPLPHEPNEFDAPQDPTLHSISADQHAVAAEALKEAETAAERSRLANLDSHAWVQKMWELAKKLDPTRLVEDMSVCHWDHLDYYAHGDTDINSWHFYIHDYDKAKDHIAKVVNSTYLGSTFNYVPGFKHRGQPLINSEYGGVGALDGDRDVSWSFKFLTNELRRHDQISAYIYTELHDVEWEYNGFLNYDRTRKDFGYDPLAINSSNVLPIDAPPVSTVRPGQIVRLPVSSSHYSVERHDNVTLLWRLGGVDTLGRRHELHRDSVPIPFPHHRVAHAHLVELKMPAFPMLCTVTFEVISIDGLILARNFVHLIVSVSYPALREEEPRMLILRQPPHAWTKAEWSGRVRSRARAESEDSCFGLGHGYFEWEFPIEGVDLTQVRRLRAICEASSKRSDSPQTDDDLHQTSLEVRVNDIPVQRMMLPNHPHDARGVLSYARGGRGAYGYLAGSTAEGDLLQNITDNTRDDVLRFRCAVPHDATPQGGLTIYGAECGRYPICPTLVLEWR